LKAKYNKASFKEFKKSFTESLKIFSMNNEVVNALIPHYFFFFAQEKKIV
jgi:hypothetical protein